MSHRDFLTDLKRRSYPLAFDPDKSDGVGWSAVVNCDSVERQRQFMDEILSMLYEGIAIRIGVRQDGRPWPAVL